MRNTILFVLLLAVCTGLTGCAVAGGIFKAGVWIGVLAVVAIIALIIFLVTRTTNKN